MRNLLFVLIALGTLPMTARAQDAKAILGGWLTQIEGRTHIYMLIARGDVVTGTYCVDCADPRNLAFILDGRIDGSGVRFVVRHEDAKGHVTFDDVRGALQDKQLVLTVRRRQGSAPPTTQTLHRAEPVAPVPAVTNDEAEAAARAVRARPPYVLPGPPEQLNADKLLGVWLWATGPGKQYFFIQRVGTQLLGMVCGPCENPYSMAPLDGFVIDGTSLTFNIVHQDTGAAPEHGPFNNVAHATLARNELHLKVIPSYEPPDSRPFEMTLLGPIAIQSVPP
jgi:hypothetical protein